MDRIVMEHERLVHSARTLGHIIQKLYNARTDPVVDEEDIVAYRDSVIKRFEFCYDLLWKFLKLYLEQTYAIILSSPKKIFHECIKQQIVNEEESKELLAMADDRNFTSHTYDEAIAEEVSRRIESYHRLIETLINRLKV